jgi:hypothetical protein
VGYCVNVKKDPRTKTTVGCDNKAFDGRVANVKCNAGARGGGRGAVMPVDAAPAAATAPLVLDKDPEAVLAGKSGYPPRDAPPPKGWLEDVFGHASED